MLIIQRQEMKETQAMTEREREREREGDKPERE